VTGVKEEGSSVAGVEDEALLLNVGTCSVEVEMDSGSGNGGVTNGVSECQRIRVC
jgi:hypothetical protein